MNSIRTHFQAASSSRPTIAFLGPNTSVPICRALWPGLIDAAVTHDVNLLYVAGEGLEAPENSGSQANALYDLLSTECVDGVGIWTSVLDRFIHEDQFRKFLARYDGIPAISLGEIVAGMPSLIMDSYQGMYDTVRHLIDVHGYRRLAFLRGPEDHYYAQERYRAYTDALSASGLPINPTLILPPQDWEQQSGETTVRVLLDERRLRPKTDVEALVAANDNIALGALEALQARGIRVPDDIAVTGFNDKLESRFSTPPLTSVTAPFYELGERVIEMLAALIGGETIPEKVVVPSKLIVRQSCGCVSPVVAQAAAGTIMKRKDSLRQLLRVRRTSILSDMTAAMKGFPSAPALTAQCLDAFSSEFENIPVPAFLTTLADILRQTAEAGGDVRLWHGALSALRRHALAGAMSSDIQQRLEDLCQETRAAIGEMAERVRGYRELQARQQAEALRRIGMELLTTFDVASVMEILARSLPNIDIPGCSVALYEHPEHPAAGVRVMMDCHSNERREFPERDQFVPNTSQWISQTLLSENRRITRVLEALYFQTTQIGVIFFEVGPRDGAVYDILRREISNALQGALLVQRVREHSAELTRQNYVLDSFLVTAPDRIYFKDREGRIVRANPAHAVRHGFRDPAEEIGKTDFDFSPSEEARLRYEQEQEIIRSGEPLINVEESHNTPDGRKEWTLTTKMPLRDEGGEIIGTFGISRDISSLKLMQADLMRAYTEMEQRVEERTAELRRLNECLQQEIVGHREAEHSLQVSEQQYRLLADQMTEGLVIIRDGNPIFVNTAFATMIGRAPEHILQENFAACFPRHARTIIEGRLTFKEKRTPVSQWQTELMAGSDRRIWIEIEQRVIAWDNQPAQLLTIRDITERKLQETRLEQERARLQEVNVTLKSTIGDRFRFGQLVGKSPAMQRVYELIVSAATSDVNVLLAGESGTGKELIARTLHQVSSRKSQAFVPVNCASIPETLFEREFFGHKKGAFTGADRDRAGFFDRAHRGTLFLDEVTELGPGTQAKLLRVLQDGEYLPLGSTQPKQADVLIVAATNKPYHSLIQQKTLREDFFYRICVIEIQVPPLRDRKEDISLLVEHFLSLYRRKQQQRHLPQNSAATVLPGQILEALYAYSWPGNIRELQNVLQRYLATLHLDDALPLIVSPDGSRSPSNIVVDSPSTTLSEAVKAFEKQVIADALLKNRQNLSKTAASLKVPFSTLHRKVKQYGLKADD